MADKKQTAKFGWFSAEQARRFGTSFYSTFDGGEIEISTVSSTSAHGCHWPDMKFVGEVIDWSRHGSTGTDDILLSLLGPGCDDDDFDLDGLADD